MKRSEKLNRNLKSQFKLLVVTTILGALLSACGKEVTPKVCNSARIDGLYNGQPVVYCK